MKSRLRLSASYIQPARVLFLVAGVLLGSAWAQDSALPLPATSAQGATSMQQVVGRVESQNSAAVWHAVTAPVPLEAGLRTGTGRVVLGNAAGGRITVGSASTLRLNSQETDFQQGSFLLDGPVTAFALGSHLSAERPSRVRVDLSPDGSTRRLAVVRGAVRISSGSRTFQVQEGQQISLTTWKIAPFRETDPWYTSQFTGVGSATLEALRGTVQVRTGDAAAHAVGIGTDLNPGDTLVTGAASWAEVGFSGGGYLRLTEQSELRVLAVEKTTRGREVTLQLLKGSAWNVVEKGQGGYKISTPVVSTAVRGTRYRVDANGMVKVVEGEVALPSGGDSVVEAGQQKAAGEAATPLVQDDLDRLNMQLDAQHDLPMTLTVEVKARQQQALHLSAVTLPDTLVRATATAAGGQPISLQVTGDTSLGQFIISEPAGQPLPEGRYQVLVQAVRFRQRLVWTGVVRLNRTPPTLGQVQRQIHGRVVIISGQASDNSGQALSLRLEGGSGHLTRSVHGGAFRLLLPLSALSRGPLTLVLQDGAGNESHVSLP